MGQPFVVRSACSQEFSAPWVDVLPSADAAIAETGPVPADRPTMAATPETLNLPPRQPGPHPHGPRPDGTTYHIRRLAGRAET